VRVGPVTQNENDLILDIHSEAAKHRSRNQRQAREGIEYELEQRSFAPLAGQDFAHGSSNPAVQCRQDFQSGVRVGRLSLSVPWHYAPRDQRVYNSAPARRSKHVRRGRRAGVSVFHGDPTMFSMMLEYVEQNRASLDLSEADFEELITW